MAQIYTYSVIRSAAKDFVDKVPYVVAVIEENGQKFSTRIEGYEESMAIDINQEVYYSHDDELGNRIYNFTQV